MERVTANLSGNTRHETLAGRNYLVAPATLIVPGVLNGNKGPLYYPEEEVSLRPWAWNNVPIVLYHPRSGSARVPKVLDETGLGHVFNTEFRDGALRAELWFDIERTKALAPEVYQKVENGEQEEISTGLQTSERDVPEGTTFNSPTKGAIPYKAIAYDYRPDHLAILPGMRGACSVADGCGVNNEEGDDGEEDDSDMGGHVGSPSNSLNEGESTMTPEERKAIITGLITNSCCWTEEDRSELEAMTDNALRRTKDASDKATENEELVAAAEKGFEAGNAEYRLNRKTGQFEKEEKEVTKNSETPIGLTEEDRILLNKAAEIVKRDEQRQEQEKEQTINALVSRYPEEERKEKRARFNGMTLEQLQTVSEMTTPTQNFYGPTRTVPATRQPKVVENSLDGVTNKDDDQDMAPPEIDWAEASVLPKS